MATGRYLNVRLKQDERVFFTAKQRLLNYIDSQPKLLSLLAIAWDGFSKVGIRVVTVNDW